MARRHPSAPTGEGLAGSPRAIREQFDANPRNSFGFSISPGRPAVAAQEIAPPFRAAGEFALGHSCGATLGDEAPRDT